MATNICVFCKEKIPKGTAVTVLLNHNFNTSHYSCKRNHINKQLKKKADKKLLENE